MPEYTYTGPYGRHYPESRDALNLPVGQVEPGDTRDLDAPLDGDWTACDPPGDGKRKTADSGKDPGGKTATTDTKAGTAGKEG